MVAVDDAGYPTSFLWRGAVHVVTGIPQRFYRRRGAWWRRPRIIDRLDAEIWRVEAAVPADQTRQFDLRNDPDRGWVLELEWV